MHQIKNIINAITITILKSNSLEKLMHVFIFKLWFYTFLMIVQDPFFSNCTGRKRFLYQRTRFQCVFIFILRNLWLPRVWNVRKCFPATSKWFPRSFVGNSFVSFKILWLLQFRCLINRGFAYVQRTI